MKRSDGQYVYGFWCLHFKFFCLEEKIYLAQVSNRSPTIVWFWNQEKSVEEAERF